MTNKQKIPTIQELKVLTLQEAKDKGLLFYSFYNGDYSYEKDGIEYLIRDGKEIAKGWYVDSFDNGDYSYEDKYGIEHAFNKEHKEIK